MNSRSFFLWDTPRFLVDIRPAGSFQKGSLPGAVSFPLDNDADVADLLNTVNRLKGDRPVHLLDLDGQMAPQLAPKIPANYLEGGYKAFKDWREQVFSDGPPLWILGGYTGSGKTDLLRQLQLSGAQVLDLEKLAAHKGSVFGELPEKPRPLHEQFQNELLSIWLTFDPGSPVWLEEKGPFLGKAGLPQSLYERMRKAPLFHLNVPFEQRLPYILQEYSYLPDDQFRTALKSLESRMGTSQNHKALHYHDSGQKEKCYELLLQYYDRGYELRRKEFWSGKIIPVEHRHDAIPATIDRLQALRRSYFQ